MELNAQHVLIVEDDPVTRDLLIAYFGKAGFQTSAVEGGHEMWKVVQNNNVDLTILDINLPDENGFSLLGKLRSESDMGIILVTSRQDQVDRNHGLQLGADDYMTKPFDEEELLLRSRSILNKTIKLRSQGKEQDLEQDLLSECSIELKSIREQNVRLLEKQDSFIKAQKISKIGSWDWDIINDTLFWSDEIYRVFGLNPQEFGAAYDAFIAAIHPDDRERVHGAVNKALEDKSYTYQIKHRVILPDGSERFVHERGEVLRDINEQPLRMIGTVMDVTDRQIEEEREIRAISSRIAISALLETGLEPLSLLRQLEIALDIILAMPWLGLLNKGSIFLVDQETDDLVMSCQKNLPEFLQKSCARITPGQCLCGLAAQSRQLVFSDCLDQRHITTYEGIQEHGHLCVPILSKNNLLGVLNLYLPHLQQHTPEEDAFLSTVANTLAGLIERRHRPTT
jgi:PAS domain S-box-containing protein